LATVAGFGDSRRIRRQSPFAATVAEFGDYSRQCGQGLRRRLWTWKTNFTLFFL